MWRLRTILFCALLAGCPGWTALPACAQHGGGGGHGGMGPGGGMGGFGGFGGDRTRGAAGPNVGPSSAGSIPGMRSKTRLGLLGRWWDDKHFAKDLKLRPEQQQRMDAIFEMNRPALAKGLQDYQTEQGRLEAMYGSKTLDENTLYTQIDKVSQARAELGKAYTHYLLQIRAEMNQEQLTKLDTATNPQ